MYTRSSVERMCTGWICANGEVGFCGATRRSSQAEVMAHAWIEQGHLVVCDG